MESRRLRSSQLLAAVPSQNVKQENFESLSLRYSDGCYYLRNDRIFGAIVLDPPFQMVSQGREISDEANKMIGRHEAGKKAI